MERRLSCLYRRQGRYFICSMSQTVNGIWGHSAPCTALDGDASNEQLGAALLRSLRASRQGVPDTPPEADTALSPLMELAGARSNRQFMEGCSLVLILEESGQIEFEPQQNNGARNGFVPLSGVSIFLKTSGEQELGRAAVEAIGKAL